jgi:hypothetical protein
MLSKIVDDATKEAIGTNAECIRDMRKEILHLKKQERDSNGLEGKVSWLNSDIVALVIWRRVSGRVCIKI